jgi:Mitochondrial carrier protein
MYTDILRESVEVIDVDIDDTRDNQLGDNRNKNNRRPSSFTYLWKGLTPALLLCMNPAIHYTVYDIFKNRLLTSHPHSTTPSSDTNHHHPNTNQYHRRLSMSQAFFLGLTAKFVATIATYPLIRAKVILMVTSETSLWSALIKSYHNDDGIRGLYKGCDWQLLHTLLKSALMMMVREYITEQTHRWIVGGGEESATKLKSFA